ncbi:hypothetical protein M8C21_012709, partial [Ambrosia artemisiifolia]
FKQFGKGIFQTLIELEGRTGKEGFLFLMAKECCTIIANKAVNLMILAHGPKGQETIHQLYGTRVAVLAGDFMFAQSSWYLANLENLELIKLITQVIKGFASGEIKQAPSLFDCGVKLDE